MDNNMNTQTFKIKLYEILKKDSRLFDEEENLNQTLLFDLIDKVDEKVIGLLLEDEDTKEKFFTKIKDAYVFKSNDFKFFLDENKIFNSYTQYKNQIGLSDGKEFIIDRKEVVLNFPFKDCVLEGGQTTEDGEDRYFQWEEEKLKDKLDDNGDKIKDGRKNIKEIDVPAHYEMKSSKRKEIFFNQVLAKDEIDRLFDPKALVNWKKYTKNGKKEITDIRKNEDGVIQENLIIKGNNLLALKSLKSEFSGKIKLIYIDPPYNTGADDFKYNDRFNHSTWLTFMRNRLESAKDLLSDKGAIFIHIDHHEVAYLKVLMDEIFNINSENNFVQLIAIKTASPAGFKTVNPGPIDVSEYILFYTKHKSMFDFVKHYIPTGYDDNYKLVIENIEDDPKKWRLTHIRDCVYKENGIKVEETYHKSNKNAEKKWGKYWKIIREELISEYALKHKEKVVSIRDPHKPTNLIKELQAKSKEYVNTVFSYKRADGTLGYIMNGGALSFYSNKVKNIDGELTSTELLTDFWKDISWDGIAKEGGVKLKNGKKPEKLIRRIIEISTKENDIVLDYHLGSGTTCAVAHKMNRQYIGIEQLDYKENDSVVRLQNVINGDTTGISKFINWKGGGEFIYFELAKWNEVAKEAIVNTKSIEELKALFEEMYRKYFLNYNLKIKEFKEIVIKEEGFLNLTLEEQKRMFLTMLDLNQMYIPASEIEDEKYGVSKEDQKLTKMFYGEI